MNAGNDRANDREFPERPWVGVGVVVCQGERVLLVRRGKAPRMGQWGIPGGAQHVGETLFEAAAREVREETGLVVTPTAVITALDAISRDPDGRARYHYTLVEVLAECPAGDPLAADDAMDARWATLEEARALIEWDETLRVIGLGQALRVGHL